MGYTFCDNWFSGRGSNCKWLGSNQVMVTMAIFSFIYMNCVVANRPANG